MITPHTDSIFGPPGLNGLKDITVLCVGICFEVWACDLQVTRGLKNAFEDVVCKMSAISCSPQWVNEAGLVRPPGLGASAAHTDAWHLLSGHCKTYTRRSGHRQAGGQLAALWTLVTAGAATGDDWILGQYLGIIIIDVIWMQENTKSYGSEKFIIGNQES